MQGHQSLGPFCQSYGMPMEQPEDFGIAADGYRVNDYCYFCFQSGVFTEPNISVQGMIDRCVGIMVQRGVLPEAQAKTLMTEVIPNLKRWQTR